MSSDSAVGTAGFDEHREHGGARHKLAQEFEPLRRQLNRKKIDPCQVAARSSEAGDKTELDWVVANDKDDWDRRSCRLSRQHHRGTSARDDHGDPLAYQIGGHHRQPFELIVGEAVFDRHVLAFDVARLFESLAKSS